MGATVTSRSSTALPALAAPLACGACLAAGAAYVAANEPGVDARFIPCPFRALTGLWCPGCGMTRAAHHLLRGDVIQALRYNVFVVVILASFAAGWSYWAYTAATARPSRTSVPTWAAIASVVVLVAFAVVRNLPMVSGLRG